MTGLSGIYQIRNIVNGNIYIGQSVDLYFREKRHFSELRHDRHHSRHLQHAYNKYGADNFVFEVLIYCKPEELTRLEQEIVDRASPAYNICRECVETSKGVKRTEESRKKSSNSHRGVPLSEEHRKHIGESGRGRPVSQKTRSKMSVANIGKRHSEESRRKMSLSRAGKTLSEEHKKNIGLAGKGRKHTEETRRKISETKQRKKAMALLLSAETQA